MLRQQNPSDVEVAITPEELEGLDEASIQGLYNQRVAEERARNSREVSMNRFSSPCPKCTAGLVLKLLSSLAAMLWALCDGVLPFCLAIAMLGSVCICLVLVMRACCACATLTLCGSHH